MFMKKIQATVKTGKKKWETTFSVSPGYILVSGLSDKELAAQAVTHLLKKIKQELKQENKS